MVFHRHISQHSFNSSTNGNRSNILWPKYWFKYCTNTAYSTRFYTNRFATGAVNSIDLLGAGTRDVEIKAPLKVKGASATLNNGVRINGALVVGTTNVMNAVSSISQTPGPAGPQGAPDVAGATGPQGP